MIRIKTMVYLMLVPIAVALALGLIWPVAGF